MDLQRWSVWVAAVFVGNGGRDLFTYFFFVWIWHIPFSRTIIPTFFFCELPTLFCVKENEEIMVSFNKEKKTLLFHLLNPQS